MKRFTIVLLVLFFVGCSSSSTGLNYKISEQGYFKDERKNRIKSKFIEMPVIAAREFSPELKAYLIEDFESDTYTEGTMKKDHYYLVKSQAPAGSIGVNLSKAMVRCNDAKPAFIIIKNAAGQITVKHFPSNI